MDGLFKFAMNRRASGNMDVGTLHKILEESNFVTLVNLNYSSAREPMERVRFFTCSLVAPILDFTKNDVLRSSQYP